MVPTVSSIFVLVVLTVGSAISEVPPDFEKRVEDLVQNVFLPRNNNPGVALAVVSADDSLTLTRGYGLKDIEKNAPMEDSTLFNIGSISKSFCACIVANVLSKKFPAMGEAVLDHPIAKLAPNLNFTFSDRARAEQVSFRDLLSHRTCLAPDEVGLLFGGFTSSHEYGYRTRYAPELCPYRTGYNYNNGLFALAGELIAEINGNTNYNEILQEFLTDLGMTNTRFVRSTEDYENWENISTPYYLINGDLVPRNKNLLRRLHVAVAAGGILSSASDMVKYLRFHLNLGKVGDIQVVPEHALKWLYIPSNPFEFDGYKTEEIGVNGHIAYGLGLGVGFFEGTRKMSHGGYWPPYLSEFSVYPNLKVGMFSALSGPGSPPETRNITFTQLHNAIVSLLQDKSDLAASKLTNTNKASPESILQSPKCINCVQVNISDLPGVYGSPSQGELEIYQENDLLRIRYGTEGDGTIVQTSSSQFLVEWDSEHITDFFTSNGITEMYLNFIDNDSFFFLSPVMPFMRNVTLETLPAIPWAPGSCAAA